MGRPGRSGYRLPVRKLALVALLVAGCGSATATVTKTVTTGGSTSAVSATSYSATAGPIKTYRVPAPSMEPTLSVGQAITVSLNPNYVPAVGDIIVFHPPAGADPATPACGNPDQGAGHPAVCSAPTPSESSQTFVKRVVAGPGDTISTRSRAGRTRAVRSRRT